MFLQHFDVNSKSRLLYFSAKHFIYKSESIDKTYLSERKTSRVSFSIFSFILPTIVLI